MKVFILILLSALLITHCKTAENSSGVLADNASSSVSPLANKTYTGAKDSATFTLTFDANKYVNLQDGTNAILSGNYSYEIKNGKVNLIHRAANNMLSYVAQFALSADGQTLSGTVKGSNVVLTLATANISLAGKTYQGIEAGGTVTITFNDGKYISFNNSAKAPEPGLYTYEVKNGQVNIIRMAASNIKSYVAQYSLAADGQTLTKLGADGGSVLSLTKDGASAQ